MEVDLKGLRVLAQKTRNARNRVYARRFKEEWESVATPELILELLNKIPDESQQAILTNVYQLGGWSAVEKIISYARASHRSSEALRGLLMAQRNGADLTRFVEESVDTLWDHAELALTEYDNLK
jgi:hypothetical protein